MVYAVSDLHGCYSLYSKICEKLNADDKVFFLGDAGDRGPDGLKTIEAILDNPQWVYLKGNHEDMLVRAFKYGDCLDCFCNGGRQTFNDLTKDIETGRVVVNRLKDLPFVACYENSKGYKYWMTHAGFTPQNSDSPYDFCSIEDLIWDRYHLGDDDFSIPENYNNTFIIHGHTPIQYAEEYAHRKGHWMGTANHSPYQYGQDIKIDIDACSFRSNEAFLFNLDTHSFELIVED